MRTLMIAPQPFFQPRGTPFSVLHRLNALSKLGYKVDLLTYHLGEDIEIDGVTIHRIPKVPFVKKIAIGPSKIKVILDFYLILKSAKMLRSADYDLIHSHEEAGFFATYLAQKYNILHLYDMHSSLPQQLSNFKFTQSNSLIRWFERLEVYVIGNADAVITICPELYYYVARMFPGTYNGLIENVAENSIIFTERPENIDIKDKIKTNGELVVLYTGTFEPYQGIDFLIDACLKVIQEINNVKFVLVGGKPEQVETYKNKVNDLNLNNKFLFTGSVLPQQVAHYIDICDVLVSPRIEGNNTPLKIYSYLRSGKPIVATKHITHTQVLNQNTAILTECNPEAFGSGMIILLQNSNLRRKVGYNAKKLAQEKYSYQSYLNKTKEVYNYLERQLEIRRRNH